MRATLPISETRGRRGRLALPLAVSLAVLFLAYLCPGARAAGFDPKFFEEQRQAVDKYLSAERLQGHVGEELVVTSKLPDEVKEADFTLEAHLVSPEGENGLELTIAGREVRLKATKPGEFVVVVVGIRPTPYGM